MVFIEYVESQIAAAESLDEAALKSRWVYRKRKKVKKWYSTDPKYKVTFDGNGKPRLKRHTKQAHLNLVRAHKAHAGAYATGRIKANREKAKTDRMLKMIGASKHRNRKDPIINHSRARANGDEAEL